MQTFILTRRAALAGLGAALVAARSAAASSRPLVTVHKDPSCGCCGGWVEHLKRAGFPAKVIETSDLNAVKARFGVPDDLASCHTAELDGYVIEGHVPARAIDRLLAERPQARGLAVPGMPLGSPGMGGEPEVYEVVLFDPERRVFGKFRADREV
jgi:hypothetical protein